MQEAPAKTQQAGRLGCLGRWPSEKLQDNEVDIIELNRQLSRC